MCLYRKIALKNGTDNYHGYRGKEIITIKLMENGTEKMYDDNIK